jgi:REP element-mobilizing transposase RayT
MVLFPAGRIAEHELSSTVAYYSNVWIDRFVVMPNHVHAIIVIDGLHPYSAASAVAESNRVEPSGRPTLFTIVGGYKSAVSRLCHLHGIADFQWQPRFYDHIPGSNAAVNAVREYIRRNPENWREDPDYARSQAD